MLEAYIIDEIMRRERQEKRPSLPISEIPDDAHDGGMTPLSPDVGNQERDVPGKGDSSRKGGTVVISLVKPL